MNRGRTLSRLPARVRTRGFTLIELLVTIAVMAMLLLAAMPFTRAWVDGTRQIDARSHIVEAAGQARTLAMRNPHALPATHAGRPLAIAATLYDRDTRTLCVVQRGADRNWSAGRCPTGAPGERPPYWIGRIADPGRLDLSAGDAAFNCVGYDSRGRIQVVDDLPGHGCVSAATPVSIVVGGQGGVDAPLL